ncbi:hypothetical protein [Alkalicoccobacillus murimartini]|uniref:DUF3188 domain-containing protein n=1 Tax=Alkalicoccobacillus murimartini TaxID=171685 RepID=A0ABT9YKX7_9BACI|nr:hypothetical protein [Alkalicoccobacillus murimartini]MDQ0208505.1 hypothetical protein [Alkalicoccobacillus murimartini]
MRGSEFINAIQVTLYLLTGFVGVYVLLTINDPIRGGKGMLFLLAVMGFILFLLARVQKKLRVKKEDTK